MSMHKNISTCLLLVFLGLALVIALFFDVVFASYLPLVAYVGYGVAWIIVVAPLMLKWPSRVKNISLIFFLVIVMVLYLVPTKREVFLEELARIQPGMTESEVEEIMGHYVKGSGWPVASNTPGTLVAVGSDINTPTKTSAAGALSLEDSVIYRHTALGSRSADWGVVTYEDGRVARIEFLPD